MRDTQRDRRRIRPSTLVVLRPLFRYSAGRDAYVLRIVGNRFGPVLEVASPALSE
jgi:hypothetical protein